LSEYDQAGQSAPSNPPQALFELLQYWQTFESFDNEAYLPAALDE
jgi:hypothetical protein